MSRYLIVANVTLGGDRLWALVRERMEAGPCRFHVVVPTSHDPGAGSWIVHVAHEEAAERLRNALEKLEALGAEASGEVGDIRRVEALVDLLKLRDVDEVLVSTLPPTASRWLRMGLVERIREAVDAPVTHVVTEVDVTR